MGGDRSCYWAADDGPQCRNLSKGEPLFMHPHEAHANALRARLPKTDDPTEADCAPGVAVHSEAA